MLVGTLFAIPQLYWITRLKNKKTASRTVARFFCIYYGKLTYGLPRWGKVAAACRLTDEVSQTSIEYKTGDLRIARF